MKYELEALEEFIENNIAQHQNIPLDTPVPEFHEKKLFVQDAVAKLKTQFKTCLFDVTDKRQIEFFIRFHQKKIILLNDMVYKTLDRSEVLVTTEPDEDPSKVNLYKHTYALMRELLTFVKDDYSSFFDLDQKMPDADMVHARRSLRQELEAVERNAVERGVDRRLIEIALTPLAAFANEDPEKDITFRNLVYSEALIEDLVSILQKDHEADYNIEVAKALVYHNFNCPRFIDFVADHVRSEAQRELSFPDQLNKLNHYLKLLRQTQQNGTALKGDNPSVKKQLRKWLTAEIKFLKKKGQLTLMFAHAESASGEEPFKVNTDLAVTQIALFIRVLKEIGVIINQNITQLLMFIATHFSSQRNENISPDSLRGKYYNIEKPAIDSLEQVLIRMLEHIRKLRLLIFYITSDWMTDLLAEIATECFFA
jgi:hypothetical protein